MAESPRQAEFDRAFRSQIDRLTPELVSALRGIVTTAPPPEVTCLVFEVESSWSDFPVYAFAMDIELAGEVYFEPPFSGHVLPDAEDLIPRGAIDQDAFEDDGVDTFESGVRVLAEWFGECWHAARGVRFPIPAYVHHHDRSPYFHLQERRWVDQSDVWP